MADNITEQKEPLFEEQAPDPAYSYERADPNREPGMGRLDAPKPRPDKHSDHLEETVQNKQKTDRQWNAEDVVNQRAKIGKHENAPRRKRK